MANDYLIDKRNQLINDARMNRFNNIVSNSINWTLPSWDEMLDRVSWIVWVNWRPTGNSWTPTVNKWVYPPWMNVWFWVPWNWTNVDAIPSSTTIARWWNSWEWIWFTNNQQQYQPFSVADTLAQRAQWYQAQGLEWLANSFKTLNRENNIYNNTANKITDYYTALANDINSRENALAQRKESLANQLSQDIANQRQYVMDYFGPNWIFTNEINKYYDENGNYLASEAGRQMAMANAEGIQSWASLWAQRAARNEAYNNAFQNYLKVKEQELTAKMNIANQLNSYMQALRQEYWDTQNTFVISQYERANNLLNAISQSMAESQASIQQARLQQALKWIWWTSAGELASALDRLARNDYDTDGDWTLTPEAARQFYTDMYAVKSKWLTPVAVKDRLWRDTWQYTVNRWWNNYSPEEIIRAISNINNTASSTTTTTS